jgi:hypothetical protein
MDCESGVRQRNDSLNCWGILSELQGGFFFFFRTCIADLFQAFSKLLTQVPPLYFCPVYHLRGYLLKGFSLLIDSLFLHQISGFWKETVRYYEKHERSITCFKRNCKNINDRNNSVSSNSSKHFLLIETSEMLLKSVLSKSQ